MKYNGVTVISPESYIETRGQSLDEMLYRAMTYGNYRKPYPSLPQEGGPAIQMTMIEGLDYKLVPASDVTNILLLPNTRVENYPCWVEIPAVEVDNPVPFADKVAKVGGEYDAEGNELVAPTDRKWSEMPGYRQLDGKHYCVMSEPRSNQVSPNGRRPVSSEILRQVVALGYLLVDNAAIQTLMAAESAGEV